MDVFRIGIIGLTGAVLALSLREERTTGFLVSLATGIVLLFVIIPGIREIFASFYELESSIGINSRYIEVMLKALGIAYVSMFSSQLCRDFSQNSIADKIELGGKIIILINTMSIIKELIEEMLGFIG